MDRGTHRLRTLRSILVVTTSMLLGFGLLAGVDARPNGTAQAFADCSHEGDWINDKPNTEGECGNDGGDGNGDGDGGDNSGPRNGDYVEFKWTACGESEWPQPNNGPEDECIAVHCVPEASSDGNDRPWLLWQRIITYENGEVVDRGIWTSTGGSRCRAEDEPDPQPDPEAVRVALSAVLPTPKAEFSPPGGRTLVNFDTILYATVDEVHAEESVDGLPIVLEAKPAKFTWNHGDGTSQTSTSPGSEDRKAVVHPYSSVGDYDLTVDVTWNGRYQFNGEWYDLPGQLTVDDGPVTSVRVMESVPVLSD